LSAVTLQAPAPSSAVAASDTREPLPWAGLRVVGAGAAAPLRSGGTVPYANLDYAASAPCLERVRDAVAAALPYYSSVHRGAGYASRVTTDAYEEARETVRRFAGAWRRDAVVFTRNTTDAMNLLAHAAPPGTTVVVFESEHHASLLPWARAVRLPVPATPDEAVTAAALALRSAPAGPRLLVVTAASNVTGELWPVERLAAVARAYGARIAVDAAQLAAHRPLDMGTLDLDYVAFSGHKLYAPFGAGVLVGRSDWLRAADPYLKGGGATAQVGPGGVRWTDDPQQRHEAGTPNVLGAIALAAACDALGSAGWDTLAGTEERLLDRLRRGLATVPGLRTLELWGDRHPRVGIVSFVLDGLDARAVACALSEEYGIGVRDGRFCAHPFVGRLLGGGAGSAVRASIGVGTEKAHVDRLITALIDLAGR
jgi:selenocysteine lyase/cysteine desulfurase